MSSQGAAKVFASSTGALLVERAPAGSRDLAQMAWSGRDDEACRIPVRDRGTAARARRRTRRQAAPSFRGVRKCDGRRPRPAPARPAPASRSAPGAGAAGRCRPQTRAVPPSSHGRFVHLPTAQRRPRLLRPERKAALLPWPAAATTWPKRAPAAKAGRSPSGRGRPLPGLAGALAGCRLRRSATGIGHPGPRQEPPQAHR